MGWTSSPPRRAFRHAPGRPGFGTVSARPEGRTTSHHPTTHHLPPSCRRTWLGSTPKGSPPDPLMRSSGWTTLTTCNIRDTMEGASSYSRGSGLARCRGFGTRGWEVVGRTWTRRPPIPYRVVVRREGSGSPTRRAPRSAFGAKGRLGYRQGHDVSLYPTTKGSTRGLDTYPTSPGLCCRQLWTAPVAPT